MFERYDPDRPDERKPGNFPKLLVCDGSYVGVVRVDIAGDTGYLRRVAIDTPWQRQGFGRTLIRLAEAFVREAGAQRVESAVAEDAVSFYEKCGYRVLTPGEPAVSSVQMYKDLDHLT